VLVFVAIGMVLAAVHERGIVHCDLKSENIIRCDDGQIKVLDFGLVRSPACGDAPVSTRLIAAGFVFGIFGYMAFE